jgi:hypothetical protein
VTPAPAPPPAPAKAPAPAPAAAPTPAPAAAATAPSPAASLESSDPQHKAARKLARLIVSEIKLYDAALAAEGLASGKVYAKLQDQIDQGIALYERRVPEAVRASFDYMRDEVVRQLAGGDAGKLGPGYPR